jgi:hypothetical protein
MDHKGKGREPLLDDGIDTDNSNAEIYTRMSKAASDLINRIDANILSLQSTSNSHAMDAFADFSTHEKVIVSTSNQINKDLKSVYDILRRFDNLRIRNTTQAILATNIRKSIAMDLQQRTVTYKTLVKKFRQLHTSRQFDVCEYDISTEAQSKGSNVDVNDETIITFDSRTKQEQQQQFLLQRDAQIDQLGTNLLELNNMIRELDMMVMSHQDITNNIEYNIDQAFDRTEETVPIIRSTRNSMRQSRLKNIYLICGCVLLLLALGGILTYKILSK